MERCEALALEYKYENTACSNLYEFLANNYDISDLSDVAQMVNRLEFHVMRLLKLN